LDPQGAALLLVKREVSRHWLLFEQSGYRTPMMSCLTDEEAALGGTRPI